MQLYRMSCPDNHLPVRWGCLHEDLRKRYLETADAAVKEWADGEEAARLRREKANRRFFCSEPNAKDLPRP
jgi:hypothetical protein